MGFHFVQPGPETASLYTTINQKTKFKEENNNPQSMNKTRDSPKSLSQAALSGFVHRFGKSTKPRNEQNYFGANEQNPATRVKGKVEISSRLLRGNTTWPWHQNNRTMRFGQWHTWPLPLIASTEIITQN